MELVPNMPQVVAEAHGLFERYETALENKDVAVLDDNSENRPHTIREVP